MSTASETPDHVILLAATETAGYIIDGSIPIGAWSKCLAAFLLLDVDFEAQLSRHSDL